MLRSGRLSRLFFDSALYNTILIFAFGMAWRSEDPCFLRTETSWLDHTQTKRTQTHIHSTQNNTGGVVWLLRTQHIRVLIFSCQFLLRRPHRWSPAMALVDDPLCQCLLAHGIWVTVLRDMHALLLLCALALLPTFPAMGCGHIPRPALVGLIFTS